MPDGPCGPHCDQQRRVHCYESEDCCHGQYVATSSWSAGVERFGQAESHGWRLPQKYRKYPRDGVVNSPGQAWLYLWICGLVALIAAAGVILSLTWQVS